MIAASGAAYDEAPPASQGGLVVQTGRDDDIKLDPKRPLRCFVNGQFVGELPLSDCAQKNGVATGALDVGLDQSGALAAANAGGAHLTPLSPDANTSAANDSASADLGFPAAVDDQKAVPLARKTMICWRYAGRDRPRRLRAGGVRRTLRPGGRRWFRPLGRAGPPVDIGED